MSSWRQSVPDGMDTSLDQLEVCEWKHGPTYTFSCNTLLWGVGRGRGLCYAFFFRNSYVNPVSLAIWNKRMYVSWARFLCSVGSTNQPYNPMQTFFGLFLRCMARRLRCTHTAVTCNNFTKSITASALTPSVSRGRMSTGMIKPDYIMYAYDLLYIHMHCTGSCTRWHDICSSCHLALPCQQPPTRSHLKVLLHNCVMDVKHN